MGKERGIYLQIIARLHRSAITDCPRRITKHRAERERERPVEKVTPKPSLPE